MRIAYHLDEHVNPRIAEALRLHGVSVTTTVDADLRTADDTAQLRFAHSEQRVLVTQDSDFLHLAKTFPDHASIVFIKGGRHTVSEIVRWLLLVYEVLTPEEMGNRIEYL